MEINARNFYKEWIKAVNSRKEELQKIWRKNTEFTKTIIGSETSIISDIANKFDLLAYEKDYYSIDTILYSKNDLTPRIKENTYWFRDIKIAFEHENDVKSGLYQEVSHLLITNCELKVLVSYPNDSSEELPYLHEIIKGTRHSSIISSQENFLIIFGYENNFEWEGFIYKKEKWIEIK